MSSENFSMPNNLVKFRSKKTLHRAVFTTACKFSLMSNCVELNISVISPGHIAEKVVSHSKTTFITFPFEKKQNKK